MAVSCLRELAPEHPEAAAALLEAAADPDATLRRAAFTALPSLASCWADEPDDGGDFETRCREAARSDPDAGVRTLAGRALELIRNEGATGARENRP
jgi:hypothetical protein